MSALAWTALSVFGVFLFAALGDLVSEEVRGWLDLAPRAVLRLAAMRLDPELRESICQDVWLPDLAYFLSGAELRPITRLIRGTTFALGLLRSARRIARLDRTAARQQATQALSELRWRSWLAYRDDPASVLANLRDDLHVRDVAEIIGSEEESRGEAIRDGCLKVDPDSVEIFFQVVDPCGRAVGRPVSGSTKIPDRA
jgi:hypothetical protein